MAERRDRDPARKPSPPPHPYNYTNNVEIAMIIYPLIESYLIDTGDYSLSYKQLVLTKEALSKALLKMNPLGFDIMIVCDVILQHVQSLHNVPNLLLVNVFECLASFYSESQKYGSSPFSLEFWNQVRTTLDNMEVSDATESENGHENAEEPSDTPPLESDTESCTSIVSRKRQIPAASTSRSKTGEPPAKKRRLSAPLASSAAEVNLVASTSVRPAAAASATAELTLNAVCAFIAFIYTIYFIQQLDEVLLG